MASCKESEKLIDKAIVVERARLHQNGENIDLIHGFLAKSLSLLGHHPAANDTQVVCRISNPLDLFEG